MTILRLSSDNDQSYDILTINLRQCWFAEKKNFAMILRSAKMCFVN